jgi:adenylosuccinate synthase
VIRFSGGHQAGHTVVLNGLRHVHSNFGSGTLRGVPTYWSPNCTVDPIGLINELGVLRNKNIFPLLYVDEKCPITTPYDVFYNQKLDKESRHGTCGVGFGTTIQRESDHYSLVFGDLFYSDILQIKLKAIQSYYNIKENIFLDRFISRVNEITQSKQIIISNSIPHGYESLIFEGSQGLLLDQNIGFFPHVTFANTGTKNIISMGYKPEVVLVTRAYQTRHGRGPMTNENIPHNIITDPEETNIENKYQGVFRRSILDLDLLEYGIKKDEFIRYGKKHLVITCIDHIKNQYCLTYKSNLINLSGKTEFIEKISNILGIKNIYISESNESKNIIRWGE